MPKISSPVMSSENFCKLLDTIQIRTPAGSKPILTAEIKAAVDKYLTDTGNYMILLTDIVKTTSEDVPYCDFIIWTPTHKPVAEGIVYYDQETYRLSAIVTKNPDNIMAPNKNPDKILEHNGETIKDISGPVYTMRAYVQTLFTQTQKDIFTRRGGYNVVDFMKNGVPAYARRHIELTFDTNGIERTDNNIKLMYDEIRHELCYMSDDEINWAAFESGQLFVENDFTKAEGEAFAKLDGANKFTCGDSSLPGDCYETDNFANLDFNWPGSNEN